MFVSYDEGQFAPERGAAHVWNVWCMTGALQVLRTKEYKKWLKENPKSLYMINFANTSAAHAEPGHPLWEELLEICADYDVEVFPLGFKDNKYIPWDGSPESRRNFDAIRIKARPTTT